MTTRDNLYKWLCYALGVLPIWLAETQLLNRIPLFGVIPVLLPLAAVAVALWEGARCGAVFGLCLGVIADATYPGTPGGMTLGLCLLGLLTGVVSQYGVRQTFVGYALCSGVSMGLLELGRVIWCMVSRLGPLDAVALVAVKEGLWSLCFIPFIYPLFKAIYQRVGGQRLGGPYG